MFTSCFGYNEPNKPASTIPYIQIGVSINGDTPMV